MPVRKVKGGWSFGGKAVYKNKATAQRAYQAYRAKKGRKR
jgi:hypothetical protein